MKRNSLKEDKVPKTGLNGVGEAKFRADAPLKNPNRVHSKVGAQELEDNLFEQPPDQPRGSFSGLSEDSIQQSQSSRKEDAICQGEAILKTASVNNEEIRDQAGVRSTQRENIRNAKTSPKILRITSPEGEYKGQIQENGRSLNISEPLPDRSPKGINTGMMVETESCIKSKSVEEENTDMHTVKTPRFGISVEDELSEMDAADNSISRLSIDDEDLGKVGTAQLIRDSIAEEHSCFEVSACKTNSKENEKSVKDLTALLTSDNSRTERSSNGARILSDEAEPSVQHASDSICSAQKADEYLHDDAIPSTIPSQPAKYPYDHVYTDSYEPERAKPKSRIWFFSQEEVSQWTSKSTNNHIDCVYHEKYAELRFAEFQNCPRLTASGGPGVAFTIGNTREENRALRYVASLKESRQDTSIRIVCGKGSENCTIIRGAFARVDLRVLTMHRSNVDVDQLAKASPHPDSILSACEIAWKLHNESRGPNSVRRATQAQDPFLTLISKMSTVDLPPHLHHLATLPEFLLESLRLVLIGTAQDSSVRHRSLIDLRKADDLERFVNLILLFPNTTIKYCFTAVNGKESVDDLVKLSLLARYLQPAVDDLLIDETGLTIPTLLDVNSQKWRVRTETNC